MERRERPRPKSTLTKIKDVTYTVLRQHEQEKKNADNVAESSAGSVYEERRTG
jgi:hypothetical protein